MFVVSSYEVWAQSVRQQQTTNTGLKEGKRERLGIEAAVRSCRAQGTPLKGFCILFYQKKEQLKNLGSKITTRLKNIILTTLRGV